MFFFSHLLFLFDCNSSPLWDLSCSVQLYLLTGICISGMHFYSFKGAFASVLSFGYSLMSITSETGWVRFISGFATVHSNFLFDSRVKLRIKHISGFILFKGGQWFTLCLGSGYTVQ